MIQSADLKKMEIVLKWNNQRFKISSKKRDFRNMMTRNMFIKCWYVISYLYLLLQCILIPMVLSCIYFVEFYLWSFVPVLLFYLKLLYIVFALLLVFSSLVHTYIRVPPNFHLGVLL